MPNETQRSSMITAGTLHEAVSQALASAMPGNVPERSGDGHVVIYAGEGERPVDALWSAIGNIRALCDDHRCRPKDVIVDGVMRTDGGIRIWGTLECVPGDTLDSTWPREIALEQDEEGTWTVTMRLV